MAELFSRLFIFIVFIYLILFVIFVLILVFSIINITKQKKKDFLLFLPILILALTLIISFHDFTLTKVKLELNLYMNKRLEIIEKIKNGELKCSYSGNIKLRKHKYVSQDGSVYVYQNDDEQVISFWVFRGMLSGSTELIYSSQDEKLIRKNEGGHPITNIIKLKDHWYYVITDY